jgi:class 3 adenylate cyclase
MRREIRYAKSGDLSIAYQVVGSGPLDLVLVPGWVSAFEVFWEEPGYARLLERLASFSRLILFDKRGTGLSDRVPISELPTLEQRIDDVRAVMDAVGSERVALFGTSEASTMCLLFAATYPARTTAVITYGGMARRLWAPDYPWAPTVEQRAAWLDMIEATWGGTGDLAARAPSVAHDERFQQWWSAYQRRGASPGAAVALARMNEQIDVRAILPSIQTPTLILHRPGDRTTRVEGSRYLAEHIPGARYVEVPGQDHLMWVGDSDAIVDEIEEFLTGARHVAEPDRVLATVLFTDIVASTEHLARLGDGRWRDLLDDHFRLARREIARYRGREVKTTGDGVLASFDGPARAIRCAGAIRDVTRELGIEIRAGLHTGEVEILGQDLGGIAVHTGARVVAEAGPGEVLVSGTVKDLVAGSGIEFEDRGTRTLKGIPGEWRLFAAEPAAAP